MMFFLMFLIYGLLVVMLAITPYITRKTESFGVSIPSDVGGHPEIQKYRKQYLIQSFGLGLALMAVMAVFTGLVNEEIWAFVYSAAILLYIICSFLIYFRFHKKMKNLKEMENWKEKKQEVIAVDLSLSTKKITYSNFLFLIPLLITAAVTLWMGANFDQLPDKIPMQYNLEGEVIRWADKTDGSLFILPILQIFLTGLFMFINVIIARSKQILDPADPDRSARQNIIFRRRWSLFTVLSSIVMVVILSAPIITIYQDINHMLVFSLTMGGTLLIVIGAFVLSVTTGQGGSRVRLAEGKKDEKINRDEDKYWKLGQIYFNPDDPALWVEKRFGVGWTINFGRPAAVLTFLGILLLPIILILLFS